MVQFRWLVDFFEPEFFVAENVTTITKTFKSRKEQLKEDNKKICLIPSIQVEHYGGKSHNPIYAEKMEIQRNWHYLWSLFYFSKKHYGIFYAYRKTLKKFISAIIKLIFYYFFNKKKYLIYKHRFLGLLNSYLGRKSSFRVIL